MVSDGSTDDTVAEAYATAREAERGTGGRVSVRVLCRSPGRGKAVVRTGPTRWHVISFSWSSPMPGRPGRTMPSNGQRPPSLNRQSALWAVTWRSSGAGEWRAGRPVLAVREMGAAVGKPIRFDGQRHGQHRGRTPRAVVPDPPRNRPRRCLLAAVGGDGRPSGHP